MLRVRAMHNDTHKFSPSVCVVTGKMAAQIKMLMEQQIVTNPAVIHDLCAMTKH